MTISKCLIKWRSCGLDSAQCFFAQDNETNNKHKVQDDDDLAARCNERASSQGCNLAVPSLSSNDNKVAVGEAF